MGQGEGRESGGSCQGMGGIGRSSTCHTLFPLLGLEDHQRASWTSAILLVQIRVVPLLRPELYWG